MADVVMISSDSDSDLEGGESVARVVFTPTKRPPSPGTSDEEEDFVDPDSPELLSDGSVIICSPPALRASSKEDPPCKKRIKFEMCEDTSHIYYKGDKQLPIFSNVSTGYGFDQLIEILMTSSIDKSKICSVRPCGVSENATFVVDLDIVRFTDLKSDDLGSWNATGTKSTFFRITERGVRIADKKPSKESLGLYHVLTRRYYVHNTYHLYHRLIADVKDNAGTRNKLALVQYSFDGPEIQVKVKPHGNAKSDTPFLRTSESARERIQNIAASEKPKSAIFALTKEAGGEVEVASPSMLPRNRQQISNVRRSHTTHDKNVLYSVMLECKLTQGSNDAFVRDVKAAPSPQSILFFDWQLRDMERFLSNNRRFGVLTVDTTFNLGEFYVTIVTYPQLMLQDVRTGKHPTMVGPVLIHQQTDFPSFNYFAATLISHNKKLRNALCFGTDGDKALVEAFAHNFPYALQLRCFIHFKKNVQEKLRSLSFPSSVSDEVLADIFGKHTGSVYKEGLVDCISEGAFDTMLQHLKEVWDGYEQPFAPARGPQFHSFFVRYQAEVVKYHMRKDLREAAGLGYPPTIFTTNPSESINAVLKKKVDYKQHEWPKFNEHLKQMIEGQREEVIRSLSGRGQYRLCAQYVYLSTSILEWSKMRPDQRKKIIADFDSSPLRPDSKGEVEARAVSQSSEKSGTSPACLSVNAEDSGIETLPLVTLQGMWEKASKLLTMENGITAAPSDDRRARMASSFSGKTPHFVSSRSNGQYMCDSTCTQWNSAKICSHTLAVAETNAELQQFLQWYTTSGVNPNITVLGMEGLSKGRAGQKGGRSKRKRTRTDARPEHLVTVTQCNASSECGPSGVNIGASTSQINYNVLLPSTSRAPPPLISIPVTPPTPPTPPAPPAPYVNPFYLKFIKGNIRVCQGCRGSLKTSDGAIPSPPFDLTVARAEQRPFRDSSGNLITPKRPTVYHYHCKLECIQAVEPQFVPSSIHIPADVRTKLCTAHIQHLMNTFRITLS